MTVREIWLWTRLASYPVFLVFGIYQIVANVEAELWLRIFLSGNLMVAYGHLASGRIDEIEEIRQ